MMGAASIAKAIQIAAVTASLGLGFGQAAAGQTTPVDSAARIKAVVTGSQCAAHPWAHHRGVASPSYVQGVALVFARSLCHPERDDVKVVSAPVDTSRNSDDALNVYQDRFAALGMSNDKAGVDTLRHSYVLLLGLGMMESSGRFCDGRDTTECFASADSAEAGLFQTSYGARRSSPVLTPMFQRYQTSQDGCLLGDFRGTITCKILKSQNARCPDTTSDVAGSGPGADWQRLTKICPAFATEYGAVVLRKHGGPNGEFNPIRKQEAELLPECDAMFKKVQDLIT